MFEKPYRYFGDLALVLDVKSKLRGSHPYVFISPQISIDYFALLGIDYAAGLWAA